jgi:hypothetical protein
MGVILYDLIVTRVVEKSLDFYECPETFDLCTYPLSSSVNIIIFPWI